MSFDNSIQLVVMERIKESNGELFRGLEAQAISMQFLTNIVNIHDP